MNHDWRAEIVRLVEIKQRIFDADREGLWEFHLPRVAATAERVASAEQHLGITLEPGYRSLLLQADGWPSFFQSVDLFGVDDLMGGPRMDLAEQVVAALEPAVLTNAGLEGVRLIPVAATTIDRDLFVMPVRDGVEEPPIVWFAGEEVDRYPTFHDYFLAMIEYNRRELEALERADGRT